jgi:hypothetical protein
MLPAGQDASQFEHSRRHAREIHQHPDAQSGDRQRG